METFWFFWLRLRRSYDSAYDSDFWFSLGHKRSYDSAYDSDSDSVASEKQPLENDPSHPEKSQMSAALLQGLRHAIPSGWSIYHFVCFDGESSFSIRLCHRQANKKHSRTQPTLPYPLSMSREMISKFIHQTSSFVEIMLIKQHFNSNNF